MLITIVASLVFLFLSLELPKAFHYTQTWVMWVEMFFLVVFSIDFLLRLATQPLTDAKSFLLMVFDFLAIVPSALVVMTYWGLMPEQHLEILALLRLFSCRVLSTELTNTRKPRCAAMLPNTKLKTEIPN
ncbi:MAG: ion transporter, partial [Limnohabitans sp.]